MTVISAVFNERVRVRADTPRRVVPPKQSQLRSKQQLLRRGSWAGAQGFRADDPKPLGPPEEAQPPGSDLTSISAAMDLVPLPWTWGAAVELFGAHLA